MHYETIKKAIADFHAKRVAVVGDLILDRYTFGDVSRISPEAPIPILKKTHETFVLGGAANTAHNAATLGARVTLAGLLGDDTHKDMFAKLAKEGGIDLRGVMIGAKPTIVKNRVVSGNHQLLRIDEEDTSSLPPELEEAFVQNLDRIFAESDIVVLSDYAKGLFSEALAKRVIALAKRHGKKIIADLKPHNKSFFIGVDLVKPNFKEAQEMTGLHNLDAVGAALVNYFNADVLVTRGGDGISVFERGGKSFSVPGKKVEVFDVSGAGDTATAALALSLASALDLESAAHVANAAGGVVVQKRGTATLTSEELLSHLHLDSHVAGVGIVPKAWGYEKWLENNDRYCCKLLSLNKGYQCSLHYHKNKDEMFLVTKGHVRLEKDKEVLHLREGAFVRLAPGTVHRFTGLEDSLIMEVSTHHDEDDSYRLEESRKVEFS